MAKKKSRRDHVPALDDARLAAALDALARLPVSERAKRQIADILHAARNPEAETPDAVIAALEPERKANIERTMQATRAITEGVMARGAAGLAAMSDAEFDALLEG